jgi:alkylation response protein AidB-like acyl-CoA dehydrogenase
LWWGARRNPGEGFWQRQWLWSKAASIAGGTSEVQRTIIGDRILGLPR